MWLNAKSNPAVVVQISEEPVYPVVAAKKRLVNYHPAWDYPHMQARQHRLVEKLHPNVTKWDYFHGLKIVPWEEGVVTETRGVRERREDPNHHTHKVPDHWDKYYAHVNKVPFPLANDLWLQMTCPVTRFFYRYYQIQYSTTIVCGRKRVSPKNSQPMQNATLSITTDTSLLLTTQDKLQKRKLSAATSPR